MNPVMDAFIEAGVNIFYPCEPAAGMDPVHFGVLMATIVTLGVMTPPVGSALYTVCGIIGCPPEEYTWASLPFLAAVLLEMSILVFIPQVVLFIPNLLFGTVR
jgi:TRAP-type C4-dicarboxylate transport system permease large subunit